MLLPRVSTGNGEPSKIQTIEFKGYDTRPVIDDGSMREMKNLTTDEFPNLYPRKQRGIWADVYTRPTSLYARREKLAVVDGEKFWYDGQQKFVLDSAYEGQTRQIVAINTRICIFPDQMWYNPETDEYGYLYHEITGSVTFEYNSVTFETKATVTGASVEGFMAQDAVNISGCTKDIHGYDNKTNDQLGAIISDVNVAGNYFIFPLGTIQYTTESMQSFTETNVTFRRDIPVMDFVMEYNNRLYGCKGNSIHVSKLGDPTNWNYFDVGTAECSYQVDVGTDGDFTGCAAYSSHLLFFKDNYIHKLYGYKPSNYQIVTTKCLGLESGSFLSAVNVNDVIYYKSREGIMAYTGDLPTLISPNFGKTRYKNAVAGSDGLKYYVSMQDKADDTWHMFCYDIQRGVWSHEDNTHATGFTFLNEHLVYADADQRKVITTEAVDIPVNSDKMIEWLAVFGDFDEFMDNKKTYSKIVMRLKMEEQSDITVSISVDNGEWEIIRHLHTARERVVELPIIPRRCDKFKIRIEGKGYVRIESMTRHVRVGEFQ